MTGVPSKLPCVRVNKIALLLWGKKNISTTSHIYAEYLPCTLFSLGFIVKMTLGEGVFLFFFILVCLEAQCRTLECFDSLIFQKTKATLLKCSSLGPSISPHPASSLAKRTFLFLRSLFCITCSKSNANCLNVCDDHPLRTRFRCRACLRLPRKRTTVAADERRTQELETKWKTSWRNKGRRIYMRCE